MDPARIAQLYLDTWNETDPRRRRELIEQVWTPNGAFVDPMMKGTGYDELDGLVAGVQQRFPGFLFTLLGAPDGAGEHIRFGWGLGPAGAEPPIKGTDFARIEDGRIAALTGFLDQVPVAA